MAKLIATKSLRYGGRRYKEGESFEASDRYARLYIAIGKAKPEGTKPKTAKPAAKPEAKVTAPVAAPDQAQDSTAVGGMTQRVYKRRDLTPE